MRDFPTVCGVNQQGAQMIFFANFPYTQLFNANYAYIFGTTRLDLPPQPAIVILIDIGSLSI
tara:strand:- start:21076 stop:21261 length:186 start_codon:yes stop_codon:yes gene_type:complete